MVVFEGAVDLLVRMLSKVPPPPAKALPSHVPPPPPLPEYVAIFNFDGSQYGPEYLSLAVGERLVPQQPPPSVDAGGWMYGRTVTGLGWCPPKYVIPLDIEEF